MNAVNNNYIHQNYSKISQHEPEAKYSLELPIDDDKDYEIYVWPKK